MILPIPPCLIWGDSLAAGVATRYPSCAVVAQVGAPTSRISRWPLPRHSGPTVVSTGSNDPESPTLARDLDVIRSRIPGSVIWIVPAIRSAALAVLAACRPGDRAAYAAGVPLRDGVHPRNYGDLARAIDRSTPCR